MSAGASLQQTTSRLQWFWIALILLPTCSALFISPTEAMRALKEAIWIHEASPAQIPLPPHKWRSPERSTVEEVEKDNTPSVNALEELHYALETMQTNYFEIWLGTWPDSIDWTGAVVGTFMSASLYSLSRSLEYVLPLTSSHLQLEEQKVENEINKYFSQSVAYYFGENAFEIRLEAYDDMLWVVLGWLENMRFIQLHTKAHYADDHLNSKGSWYGTQFQPAFAHRAHVFYDLASQGWDTKLCSGGMNWNPYLLPYKNAITNELFISASIGMYLYFPGDQNPSPFLATRHKRKLEESQQRIDDNLNAKTLPPVREHDPSFLKAAVDAYEWLSRSNMTNEQGLYVDGFHIRDYGVNGTIGTGKCDIRNEMVYTYNQGVLLSGLRGLWESTGRIVYLQDGHKLVRNVLNATGWNMSNSLPDPSNGWSGLGRNGILEEICDSSGRCTQDSQTFKGIFFHHLTLFCEPLPREPLIPGVSFAADAELASLHAQSCKEYAAWVVHNAVQAMKTRDEKGKFGMWWGVEAGADAEQPLVPRGAVDYRNCELDEESWEKWGPQFYLQCIVRRQSNDVSRLSQDDVMTDGPTYHSSDLNDRGRGRTVETQGGGVAVVRAMWEFVHMYQQD
jgi:hypothetical protein